MIVNYPRMRRRAAWPDDLDTALEFASANPFSISAPKNWNGEIEYSNGSGWRTWNGNEISSGKIDNVFAIYLRGIGNSIITGSNSTDAKWTLSGRNISCNGNIGRLLDWESMKNGDTQLASENCYAFMFSGCTSLVTAPAFSGIFGMAGCYKSMFSGCTSLVTAPALPATDLSMNCYNSMFSGCTSLVTAPALPATDLEAACYAFMFSGCTKIKVSTTASGTYTKAYRIPITGSGVAADFAMYDMFANTGGTFKGTPEINTTYYLDKSNTIV